jgi:hypothetical protein
MNIIRRIYSYTDQANLKIVQQCRTILLSQFPYLSEQQADELLTETGETNDKPYSYMVLVAEGRNKQVLGVAIASHFYQEKFVLLDYIATGKQKASGGIGGALYEQIKEETKKEGAWGLFFDCLPDVLEWCENETEYKQNVSRLKFYEGQGARPLVNFKYELPRSNHDVFYLMFDGLGKKEQISSTIGKRVVEAILTNKDNHCSPEYIKTVVGSIKSTRV